MPSTPNPPRTREAAHYGALRAYPVPQAARSAGAEKCPCHRRAPLLWYFPVKEELHPNPDIVYRQQMAKIARSRGHTVNTPRRRVLRHRVVLWYLAALVALCLWALRLYGVIDAPF